MYLFGIYSIFILILLSTFFACFYHYYTKNLYKEAQRKSEDLCASVGNSVSSELDNMSNISMNIVYSNAIKSNFKNFSKAYQNSSVPVEDFSSSRDSILAIYDIITAIIGPFQSASQVNLYNLFGDCVGSGYFQRVININLEGSEWYQPTMDLEGHKYFSSPKIYRDLPTSGESQANGKFISLTRLFYNKIKEPQGIVEVIKDCDQIFTLIPELANNNPSTSIYVYNDRGEVVYPYQVNTKNNYLSLIKKNHLSPSNSKMIAYTKDSKEEVLLNFKYIDNYNWTVVTAEPKASIYSSLAAFKNYFSLIIIFSILLTLAICFFISGRLTRPLVKLTKATGKITINRLLDENKIILTSADSNIKEISQLCESIRKMYEKLRSTSQEVLLSRSEETKANLQATQSLINPHFLYNCLTNISIMAEENMNDDIITMCYGLCDYFRYISSSNEMIVPLKEEILSTEKYIKCMEMRYKDDFEYTTSIEEAAKDILIPKLIIQPIIENAFKFAFDKKPPWKLQITARLTKRHWIIEIQDNGGCLSDERRNYLMNLYKNIDINQEIKSMKIGGMGLKNIYLRMKLLYGEKGIFKIENTLPQRTIFILGGPIYTSKEEYYEHNPKL
jgi:two-component system, sensor histidine kinase YesM